MRQGHALGAVAAFDTRVTDQSRLDQIDYLEPNIDDLRHGSEFRLVADAASLAGLIGEKWFETWLIGAFAAWRAKAGGLSAPSAQSEAGFALEHVARYLALLKVLERAGQLPPIRFVPVLAEKDRRAAEAGIDLVIDIGDDRTAAVLLDRRVSDDAGPLAGLENLSIRELARPTQVHTGPFRTLAEFDRPDFGNAMASRMSGRGDAFAWPSLVRIGEEAQRLALRPSAVRGLTGLGDLRSALSDEAERLLVWRFARSENEAGSEPGPIVSGELLGYLAEDGRLLAAGTSAPPALRPRFSLSSMLTMFAAEFVLHALAQTNPAVQQPAGERIARRHLQRIIVTCPADADEKERRQLCDRVAGGVDLVWAAFGWPAAGTALTPAKPAVAIGLDVGLSAQLLYLFDEVHGRFGGNMRRFMSVARGSSVSERGHLTIATVDLSSAATGLSVVAYDVPGEGAIDARLVLAERTGAPASSLVDRVMRDCILEAVARQLSQCGHPDPWRLLETLILGVSDADGIDRHVSPRLIHKILRPAASAFIELSRSAALASGVRGLRHVTIGALVEHGDGRLDPLANEIDALANAQGAGGFRLGSVVVPMRAREVARLIERHFEPTVDRICKVVSEYACDLILLSGPCAGLGRAKSLLLRKVPLAPHRIVDLGGRPFGLVGGTGAPRGEALRLLPLLGNALAIRRSLETIGLAQLPPELAVDPPSRLPAHSHTGEPSRSLSHVSWTSPLRGEAASGPPRLRSAPVGGAT